MQARPSRQLWVVALVVSAICLAGLTYALVTDWHTAPERRLPASVSKTGGGGFGFGLLVGLGGGVVLGSLLALRKR